MKAILDEDNNIIGIGESEDDARADAVKNILMDRSKTDLMIEWCVDDMETTTISSDLLDEVVKNGGDVEKHQTVIDGKAVYITYNELLKRRSDRLADKG